MTGLLTENTKIVATDSSTSAGTSTVNSQSVDMESDGGFDEVTFAVEFETAAADNVAKLQSSPDNSTWTDINGATISTVDTDDKVQRLNSFRPQARYVRLVATRGTSTVLGTILAVLSRPRTAPYNPSADYNVARTIEK